MTKRQWRLIYFASITLLALSLLLSVHNVITPFIAAFILAYLLNPLVTWLEKHRITRRWSIALVVIGIFGGMAAVFFLAMPKLYLELTKLADVLPKTINSLEATLQGFRDNFRSAGLPNKMIMVLDEHLVEMEVYLANAFARILDALPERLSTFSLLILSPVLAIYFLADWKAIENFMLRLVPSPGRTQWQRILQDLSHVVRSYVRGDLIVALIVGILTGIGVKIIGMDYAVLIGFISGVSDLIPYFGPFIGAVPIILLGLIKSPWMALKATLVVIVVQQLESNLISPKIVGDQVGLHPLWVVFALLAGGELFGIIGMLLAVPFAGMVRVVLRHIYCYLVSPELRES